MSSDIVTRRLRDAATFRMPHPKRLELAVVAEGVRVDVSLYGARRIGTVVPWSAITDHPVSPLPQAIERCCLELDTRTAAVVG